LISEIVSSRTAVQVETASGQKPPGDAPVDAQQADEEVLRPDVRVHHGFGLVRGVRQDLLGLFGEWQLGRRRDPLDEDAVPLDLPAHLLRLDVEAGEDLLDDVLPLAEDAEQQVLGLDHLGAELGGLVAREERARRAFSLYFSNIAGGHGGRVLEALSPPRETRRGSDSFP
jgi:hypothetical protein